MHAALCIEAAGRDEAKGPKKRPKGQKKEAEGPDRKWRLQADMAKDQADRERP